MVAQASLVNELASIVGGEYARGAENADFTVDGMRPAAIVRPGTYEEVASVMRHASANGLAVIPFGNGRHPFPGNVPTRYDIALSVRRMNRVVEYEPADLTLTCQAGATVSDLGPSLAAAQQMLPFGSSAEDSCIGSILARDRESNLAYGSARNFVIGLRVVTADGRIVRAGGKVVKNVAGYDLCKLFIGSLGTIGVIVEASFKLAPAPQAEDRIQLEFSSLREACDFAMELYKRGLNLWNVHIRRPASAVDASPGIDVRVDLAGSAAAVERSRVEVDRLSKETGATPVAGNSHPGRPEPAADASRRPPLTCDMSFLPTDTTALIEAIDRAAPGASIGASPITGWMSCTWLDGGDNDALIAAVRAAASAFGATVIVTCSPELKRRIDVFGELPPSFELMRRIKQQFDPNGILSPGRFVGRL